MNVGDDGRKKANSQETPPTPPILKPKSIPTILEEDEEEYGKTTPAESLGGRARYGLAPFTEREHVRHRWRFGDLVVNIIDLVFDCKILEAPPPFHINSELTTC